MGRIHEHTMSAASMVREDRGLHGPPESPILRTLHSTVAASRILRASRTRTPCKFAVAVFEMTTRGDPNRQNTKYATSPDIMLK
jgi:hypothetical protein